MKGSGGKQQESNKREERQGNSSEIITIPSALVKTKKHITIKTQPPSKATTEQIINQAFKFHSQGKISEAVKYYQYFINQGINDHRVYSNLGSILKDRGKLKAAELAQRKAITEYKKRQALQKVSEARRRQEITQAASSSYDRRQKLKELLVLYSQDKISPKEYYERRALVMGTEPTDQ